MPHLTSPTSLDALAPETIAEVRRALPEAEQISDARLRDAVIEIWARAWASSDWAELEACPKGLPLPGESLVHHTRTVVRASLALADVLAEMNGITVDRDCLLAIGLLHDVSRLHEYTRAADGSFVTSEAGRRLQHAFLAAAWAKDTGLSLNILHGIIVHTPESAVKIQSQEALILYYADFVHTDALRVDKGLEPWAKRG